MVGKRKVDQLRTNIAKMARAAESGDKEEFQKASQNVPNLLEKTNIQSHIERLEVNGSTKEEYFAKVYSHLLNYKFPISKMNYTAVK